MCHHEPERSTRKNVSVEHKIAYKFKYSRHFLEYEFLNFLMRLYILSAVKLNLGTGSRNAMDS